MGHDVFGHNAYRLEYLTACGSVLEADAIVALHEHNQFQSINTVQTQAFAKERGVGVDIGRRQVFQVERFDDGSLEFFDKFVDM